MNLRVTFCLQTFKYLKQVIKYIYISHISIYQTNNVKQLVEHLDVGRVGICGKPLALTNDLGERRAPVRRIAGETPEQTVQQNKQKKKTNNIWEYLVLYR